MKLRLLTTFVSSAILAMSLQCSYVPNQASDTQGNSSMSRKAQSEDNVESKRRYEAMAGEIESASKQLGIENLKAIQAEDEIRVWLGFGVTQPRLFILRLSDEPQANFHTLKTLQQENDEGRLHVPESVPLSRPKSGWAEFENFLKMQGIDSPIRLSQESSDYRRSPDVQVIAIETKFGDKYTLVFFHIDNQSDDAQRALTVCRRIEHEFNINMYCGTSTG